MKAALQMTFVLVFFSWNALDGNAGFFNRTIPYHPQLVFEGDTLALDSKEITLDRAHDFSGTIQILGIDQFDPSKLEKPDCGDFCLVDTTNAPKLVFRLVTDTFFNADEVIKTIALTYRKDEKTPLSTTLVIRVPPRITNVVSNLTDSEGNTVKTLVEGQDGIVSLSYVIDGNHDPTTEFILEASDANKIFVNQHRITAKQSGDTTVIASVTGKKNGRIKEIPVKILPAVTSIESKNGSSIYMTESSTAELKMTAKGTKSQELDLTRINCKADANLSAILALIKNKSGFTLNSLPLPADKQAGIAGRVTCDVDDKKSTDTASAMDISVTVRYKAGSITIDSLNGNTLLPNGSLTFLANVFDTNGHEVTSPVRYYLENDAVDRQWVSLSQQGKKLIVSWVNFAEKEPDSKKPNSRPDSLTIGVEARLDGSPNNPIVTTIPIHMATIARFSSLRVKLNVMDDQTASDLYGSVLTDEYYVLMIRLFNDLKEGDPNKPQGESILAYSSSIEIAVALEKRFDKEADSGSIGSLSKPQMKEIEKERSGKVFTDFKKNLEALDIIHRDLLSEFNQKMKNANELDLKAIKLEVEAQNDRSKRDEARVARSDADAAYQVASAIADKLRNLYRLNVLSTPSISPPNVPIANGKWYPATRDDLIQASLEEGDLISGDEEKNGDDSVKSLKDGEPNCVDTITYKPFTFEMIVNTVDRRDERSVRSRVFKLLNLIALGASSVTAVAVPAKQSDLPLGLEKYGNFLIPGLEKLFPNLKEQNRQNIVSQTMKTIEEIPFGSDITRVLFIPKKPISGLIAGQKARISQICPFYFKVKVAVVSKGGEVTVGSQGIK